MRFSVDLWMGVSQETYFQISYQGILGSWGAESKSCSAIEQRRQVCSMGAAPTKEPTNPMNTVEVAVIDKQM